MTEFAATVPKKFSAKKIMKKTNIIIVVAALAVTVSLTGCKSSGSCKTENCQPQTAATPATPAAPAVATPAARNIVRIKVRVRAGHGFRRQRLAGRPGI